ncbi:hypothetical protein [Thermosediminibacter oceani]|uniref:Uncharacterized protein n=1 Tax=Thermosediminibacter oceani (strain ATCC BAA-1034 / DSM 16646 / JW/IW-1228P) TaxID=555079 RepID=D9S133_THEOJ|nr:hypothetical protein [Thermosediminibacter oceani]ADL08912.1 hypothetical protein Toce_2200 [Thermosediminibacter oceani DSM 16646]
MNNPFKERCISTILGITEDTEVIRRIKAFNGCRYPAAKDTVRYEKKPAALGRGLG